MRRLRAGISAGRRRPPSVSCRTPSARPARACTAPATSCAGARTGKLDFIGRSDRQVKIRGFRVELEEIEQVLAEHGSVSDAAVVVRRHGPQDERLTAYYVTSSRVTRQALEAFLRRHLPQHMIPSALVQIDAMPLTANGKLDRLALKAPDGVRPELEESYVAPRTSLEQRIAGCFEQVLGIEGVGADDNFFRLGGHSLLATRVVSQLREAFGAEVALRSLFERPTVAGMAAVVVQAQARDAARRSSDAASLEALLAELEGLPVEAAEEP